ncbi:class I SAM-dependent methyltransferase [Rhizobium sp. L1K21]|nr:class I SAM-dependent methyltransferase [Rhizobium sp. L1K21]
MDLLDIGCGPGSITNVLAQHVKTAIGIDIDGETIRSAQEIAARQNIDNLRFIHGSMLALPFEDNRFDAVTFHAVLYHLDEATLNKALSEAYRVLKPGGLIAIRDSDVGGDVIYPENPDIELSLNLWQRWYGHSATDRPKFGRRQGHVLRTHGFEPVWSGASFHNHSSDPETRRQSVIDAKANMIGLSDDLIAKGLATKEEIDRAIKAWDDWGNEPDCVYLRCRCECIARKPGPSEPV